MVIAPIATTALKTLNLPKFGPASAFDFALALTALVPLKFSEVAVIVPFAVTVSVNSSPVIVVVVMGIVIVPVIDVALAVICVVVAMPFVQIAAAAEEAATWSDGPQLFLMALAMDEIMLGFSQMQVTFVSAQSEP